MNNNPNVKKTFAPISEREKTRQHFVKRAAEAPIPDPFSAESMETWWDYVEEMREIEMQLQKEGDL